MSTDQNIKKFVKQVLGCACPDEVFEHIEYTKKNGNAGVLTRITVGDRLLIHLVADFDRALLAEYVITTVLHEGVAERDSGKFNRFRLVLVTADPDSLGDELRAMLESSPLADEKVHLHIVDSKQAAGVIAL